MSIVDFTSILSKLHLSEADFISFFKMEVARKEMQARYDNRLYKVGKTGYEVNRMYGHESFMDDIDINGRSVPDMIEMFETTFGMDDVYKQWLNERFNLFLPDGYRLVN